MKDKKHNELTSVELRRLSRANQHLHKRIADLELRLDRERGERRRGGSVELQSNPEFVAAEIQAGDLATLWAAGASLHSTLEREALFSAIREIVVNLIGAEGMALFELDATGGCLVLRDSVGVEPLGLASIPLGEGRIGRVGTFGSADFGAPPQYRERAEDAELTACVPLYVNGSVWGVIAIFRLLGQKQCLSPLDMELCEMLSNQAGMALYCASLHRDRMERLCAS